MKKLLLIATILIISSMASFTFAAQTDTKCPADEDSNRSGEVAEVGDEGISSDAPAAAQ